MFIKVYKEDVIEGLQKAANILPTKTGAAYLRSIWLKAEDGVVQIMATDSNTEFRGIYTGEVIKPGIVGVQGRIFVELLRKLPGGQMSFSFEEGSGNMIVEQVQGRRRREFKLPVNGPEWFQNFSEFPEENAAVWSGDYLAELIEKISFCISDDESSESLSCLLVRPVDSGFIDACGLNGHQFAQQRFLHDELHAMLPKEGILIQKKYITELKKWLGSMEIEMNINDKRLFFRTADKKETFSMPLSGYQYPDYTAFLSRLQDAGASALSVQRRDMRETLDRLFTFATGDSYTYLDLSENEVVLSSTGQDKGSATETLDAEYSGTIGKIAFSTKNLLDILDHYHSERLTFILTGSEGPCGIKGLDDAEYTVIIMPMKIVEETYYSEEDA